jgi:hypothetical protein
VQDEFISQGQVARAQSRFKGATNNGVARDAPTLMNGDIRTMITDRTLAVLIAAG